MKQSLDISKAEKLAKIYFLKGEEETLKNTFLQDLKKRVINPQLNWNFYYAEEIDSSEFINGIFSPPFLSQLKVTIVKNAKNIPPQIIKRLNKNIDKLPSANCLVLSDIQLPSQFEQLIKQTGKVIHFKKPNRNQLKEWIKEKLKKENKNIIQEAISLLLENTSGNLSLIAREIEKLTAYTGEKREIGLQDIENIGIDTKTYNIFELIDRISEKNTGKALKTLQYLLISGTSPQQIIGMLRWQFTKLWRVKALISSGISPYKATETVKVPFFKKRDFITQAKNFSWEYLKNCFNLFLETDIQIKRGAQPDLSLELLTFRLTR